MHIENVGNWYRLTIHILRVCMTLNFANKIGDYNKLPVQQYGTRSTLYLYYVCIIILLLCYLLQIFFNFCHVINIFLFLTPIRSVGRFVTTDYLVDKKLPTNQKSRNLLRHCHFKLILMLYMDSMMLKQSDCTVEIFIVIKIGTN